MDNLIQLIVQILIFCIVAYGLRWVCTHFGLPAPVMWICGAILLIILLYWVQQSFVGGSPRLFRR